MALQEEETQQLQSPATVIDALFCEEESFEGVNGIGEEGSDENVKKHSFFPSVLLENDLVWEDDELVSLKSKEGETHVCLSSLISDGSLMVARKEAVDWILRVKAHYGFCALTAVLAVNYFDRFASSLTFKREKPWMAQLAAVACLSLAAKVEETQVPLLLDLQVEESKYVFEAKTIKRMELLVLSTLQWRMNPVTPISFFYHIIRRLGLKNHLHWDFLLRCERLHLSIIADSRVTSHLPSILATATMLHVIRDIEPYNPLEYQNQLMSVLKISEEKVNECYKLILELSNSLGHIHDQSRKRKHLSVPSSPNGIIDASFSFDSSNDSWAAVSCISSSPEPPFKRSRAQDQQMRLPSLNRVSVEVLSSPR
ncbi:cyclin-D3-2 [Castanea sativa]|uniref:cyclin-D3-2 n=1 Tax=Castanea sativa TaxID=21020 RepID=UPI003F64E6BB